MWGASCALALALAIAGCSRPAALPDRIYVSNERGDTVAAIDPATAKVVQTFAIGRRPRGLVLSDDGMTLYVAVSGSPIAGPGIERDSLAAADHSADGIAVLDLRTGKIEHVLDAGADPETFALSPDGRTLFVSNEDKGAVSAVSVDASRPTISTPVGDEPEGVAITLDGARLFVACEASDHVAMLDARTLRLLTKIPLEGRPRSTLLSRSGDVLFVAVEGAGKVAMLSTRNGAIMRLIDVARGDKSIKPMGMAEAANGHLYVSTGRAGSIFELDPAKGSIVGRIARVGARPWGIGLTPDGKLLATANGPSNDVTLISLEGGARRTVDAGAGPWGVIASGGPRRQQP